MSCRQFSHFRQCCCLCRWHWTDYYHCKHSYPEGHESGCVCSIPKGYICVAPEIYNGRGGTSGWPEHSVGCELFEYENKYAEYMDMWT